MSRLALRLLLLLSLVLLCSAQERVTGGPPPEIRDHLSSLVKAYNSGSADEWEKFAQAHYAASALKSHTSEQRQQMFERMHGDFGATIAITRVERQGPDAPLDVHMKSANGKEAVLQIDVEPDSPYRITSLRVQVGSAEDNRPASKIPPPPVNGKMPDDEMSRALDGYLQKLTADDVFAGVVLVARGGKPVFDKSYGLADRANKIPNSTATRFNLGSINKKFTETAIRQLVARGKLSFSDTVGKLLPDYPQELTRSATIDQLLGMRGGVADFFGDEFAGLAKDRFRSNADYYKFVSSQKPLFAPGAHNQYCNGCYIVLGAIIERVSGVPYEKYVEENIFKPAGMTATGAFQSDDIVPNIAMGYTRHTGNGDGPLHSNAFMRGASGSAAGGGFSTADDMLAFTEALKHGGIPDAKAPPNGGFGIAGGAPGTNAAIEMDGSLTVIVLTNLDPTIAIDVATGVSRALAGGR